MTISASDSLGALSLPEFCDRFRVSRASVYRAFAEGTGPKSFRFGKRRLISREAAREWVANLEANEAAARCGATAA